MERRTSRNRRSGWPGLNQVPLSLKRGATRTTRFVRAPEILSHLSPPFHTAPAQMRPQWFAEDKIPFDNMWADDRIWLPTFLQGEKGPSLTAPSLLGPTYVLHFSFTSSSLRQAFLLLLRFPRRDDYFGKYTPARALVGVGFLREMERRASLA